MTHASIPPSPGAGSGRAGPLRARSRAALAAGALALLLAGCAAPAFVEPGTPADAVLAKLGRPTADIALPDGGRRLQYSQMPAGSQVWNLDLDASGRVRSVDQALRYGNFDRIVPDTTTIDDIRRMYGAPMRIERVYSFHGDVWTYRFNDQNNPRLIHVHIDPAGVVRRVLFTDEIFSRDRIDR